MKTPSTMEDRMVALHSDTAVAVSSDSSKVCSVVVFSSMRRLDTDLVDEAVEFINTEHRTRGLAFARCVGRFIVERFFDGDIENFRSFNTKDPNKMKHPSYRSLAEHENLEVSYATIWNCVAVYCQLQDMPPELGEKLSYTHHRELLPLRNQTTRMELTRKAVDEKLSSRKLKSLVQEARRLETKGNRAGRPPLHPVIKALRRLEEAAKFINSDHLISELSDADITGIVERLEVHINSFTKLRNDLEAFQEDAT